MQTLKFRKGKDFKLIGSVAFINLLLAAAALMKDIMLASYLGTTYEADSLFLAFFITDMVGNNLIGSAIGTSCIPVFSKLYVNDRKEDLYKSIKAINILFFTATLIISFILMILGKSIVNYSAGGFTEASKILSLKLLYLLTASIILYPLIAIGNASLQVLGKFKVSALAPVLFNFIFLLGTTYCYINNIPVDSGIYYIVFSIILGLICIAALIYKFNNVDNDFRYKRAKPTSKNIKEVLPIVKIFLPYLLILFLSQTMLYVERNLASGFRPGSVAALNYAYRLSQFPVWVLAAAVGTVTFPKVSKLRELGDYEKLYEIIEKSLWTIIIFTIPMAVILYILRIPIISILFQRGTFDDSSLTVTADILAGYSIAVIGQSISSLCLKYLMSLEKIQTTVIIFFISSCINIFLDFFIVRRIGLIGIGYGAAVGAAVNAALMLAALNIKINRDIDSKVKKLIKVLAANMLLAIICILSNYLWNLGICSSKFLYKFVYAILTAVLCVGFYYFALKYSKSI